MTEGCSLFTHIIAATPPTLAAVAALFHSAGNRRWLRSVSRAVNGDKDKAVREAFRAGRVAGKLEAEVADEPIDLAAT